MAAVKITQLQERLMSRIDQGDLVDVEKVERYIDLVKSFRRMNQVIYKEGESVYIKNGSQEYTKAHPLIAERNKVNAQLLNIEKSFGFEERTTEDKFDSSDLT